MLYIVLTFVSLLSGSSAEQLLAAAEALSIAPAELVAKQGFDQVVEQADPRDRAVLVLGQTLVEAIEKHQADKFLAAKKVKDAAAAEKRANTIKKNKEAKKKREEEEARKVCIHMRSVSHLSCLINPFLHYPCAGCRGCPGSRSSKSKARGC
jgi:thioredoxin-like negative regulator of GroEL